MRPLPFFILLIYTVFVHAQITFQESALQLGVNYSFDKWTVGGGVSLYDFTGDGLDDLTLSTAGGQKMGFYVNTGDGFDPIDPPVFNTETVKQVLWADFDNDGDPDLYVTAFDGINRLYENQGELILVDITAASGLPLVKKRSYGACWGDVNRDGWLDLYYNERDLPGTPNFQNKNRLFLNNADGTFTEMTWEMNAADPGKIPFCSAFVDYNNDKWPDIYTANDRFSVNTLLHNSGGVSFEDVSEKTHANLEMNAMCVTAGDVNRDGWLDIYITNTAEGNKFLINQAALDSSDQRSFYETADSSGTGFYGIGWGSNFLDADNDGDLDLYVSGSVIGSNEVSSKFYENIGPLRFDDQSAQGFTADTTASFANAIGDWNNDGLIDILVQNNPPFRFHLWENRGNRSNHWIKFILEGVKSNREAVGARLDLYHPSGYQMSSTYSGFGFLGQNSRVIHFGTGQDDTIDSLVITWPTGHKDRYFALATGQVYDLKEGGSTGGVIHVDEGVDIIERPLTISTTDATQNNSLKLFPNPSKNYLLLAAEDNIRSLSIFSIDGKKIRVLPELNVATLKLDVKSLNPGIYFISITTERGRIIQKFIKN